VDNRWALHLCVRSKQTVVSDAKYSFLHGLVASVPDVPSVNDTDDVDITAHHHQLRQQQQQQQSSDVTRQKQPRGRLVLCLPPCVWESK